MTLGPGPATISQPKNINKGLVNSFAVGALNANNLNIADFSSRGPSRCGGEGSLLIKPEVSAPGVGVRSCIPGNTYAAFNGTSMAAPHVSGAVLLLKEAFPYLSGEAIKLALYFSARDLGEPGEDNVFGMGLIDVDAAFEYLVDQGHVPVDPKVNIDLVLDDVKTLHNPCVEQIGLEVQVSNAGSIPLQGIHFLITDEFENPIFEQLMEMVLEPGGNFVHQIKLSADLPVAYNYSVQVKPMHQEDERILNNSMRVFGLYSPVKDWDLKDLQMPNVDQYCGGSRIIINYPSTEGVLNWYHSASSTVPFATGNFLSLTLPEADTILNLHAGLTLHLNTLSTEASSALEPYSAEDNSGVVFLVYQDAKLESFSFECTARTFLNISLNIEGGSTLWSANRFYQPGEHTIVPNANIPAGALVRLLIRGNQNLMGRRFESDHLVKDEGILRVLEIWNNQEVTDEPFVPLYDVQFVANLPCDRKTVELPIRMEDQRPTARLSTQEDRLVFQVGESVELYNESEAASQFVWRMGDGTIFNSEEVTHTYTDNGEFTITLKAISDSGCIDMDYLNILIEEDAISSVKDQKDRTTDVYLYPNPTKSEVWIQVADDISPVQSIDILSIDGRFVYNRVIENVCTDVFRLPLPSLTSGFYFVAITLSDGTIINKKIIIQ